MMKIFKIIPHIGIGPVKLGQHREEVHQAISTATDVFEVSRADPTANTWDSCYKGDVHIYYTKDDIVEFIEIAKSPSIKFLFKERDLHRVKASIVVNFLLRYDKNCQKEFGLYDPIREHAYSYVFLDLQLSLARRFIPSHKKDTEGRYFEAVGLAAKGYFLKKENFDMSFYEEDDEEENSEL